ncbi:hypothetical protein [Brevundimonas subvibrioides]|uniref:hypothetical protein n=1 Tax=Brevundimonas subvibrioides TaxID=74313 RepID=UPI0032D596A4
MIVDIVDALHVLDRGADPEDDEDKIARQRDARDDGAMRTNCQTSAAPETLL